MIVSGFVSLLSIKTYLNTCTRERRFTPGRCVKEILELLRYRRFVGD